MTNLSNRFRTSSNWRYQIIKRYKHRAEKFRDSSKSTIERDTWNKVISWFDDILCRKRFLTKNNGIGIGYPLPKNDFVKFIHVLQSKCGVCSKLRKITLQSAFTTYEEEYCCPRNNHMIMVLVEMGEKCNLFKPLQVVKMEKETS